jgi:hypothetical protein
MSGTGGGFYDFTQGNVLPNTTTIGTSGGQELVALKQDGGKKRKRKQSKKRTKTNRKLKKNRNKKRKTAKK